MQKPESSTSEPNAAKIAALPKWADLSDAELSSAVFTTQDPESLAGLSDDVPPPDAGDPRVELSYDFRGSKRSNLRCAHCRYPNHLCGFVIRVGDTRFLCGHNCGAKLYGADFEQLHDQFKLAKTRAQELRRFERLRRSRDDLIAALIALPKHPSVIAYDATRSALASSMPRLRGALETIDARQQGSLTIIVKERDHNAEDRRAEGYEEELAEFKKLTVTEQKKRRKEGYGPYLEKGHLFRKVERSIGTLAGASVIRQPRDLLQPRIAERVDATTKALEAVPQGATDGISTKVISGGLKGLNDLLGQIDDLLQALEDLPQFFAAAHLELLGRWASANRLAGTYRSEGRRLIFIPDEADEVSVEMPTAYQSQIGSRLAAIRAAINYD